MNAKILVIDDERRICHNVKKILAKSNFEVTEALSAQEALEIMAKEHFSLLISDIVMPEMNGLELLKRVKNEWPVTKVIMMTAYASTDTAVKAIRLGALDYIPKPFTPDELRNLVNLAVSGKISENPAPEAERKAINVIDTDIPFDAETVAKQTGEAYVHSLGPSDMPVIPVSMPEPLENYCETGKRVCDIMKKLGATCKAGTKKGICPKVAAKEKKMAAQAAETEPAQDVRTLIGIDMPFSYDEVISMTGPEYVANLQNEGIAFVPYEVLKKSFSKASGRKTIDTDIPFDHDEVARQTGDAYADTLGSSDMPVVEVSGKNLPENFCATGEMVCDIFKKLGATCKAGVKKEVCPRKAAEQKKKAAKSAGPDVRTLVGIDMPFDYDAVAAATGADYVNHLISDNLSFPYYSQLKENIATLDKIRLADAKIAAKPAGTGPMETVATNDILVIDDEVAVNNNIRKILGKKGYAVDQATTKQEALEKISGASYKLVLLDLKIPGVKGLELLKAIRDTRPETRVIIITGYATIETAVSSARMGVVEYLNKPFTPNEIRHATENALRFAA